MDEALAICRVSSKEQLLSNSLSLQGSNVQTMAENLGVPIVKKWALHTSSKKGKNLKRRDLVEAKNLCRTNKKIKYILLDRVNRLGREAKYLTFYMLDLEINFGVQLIFCDPSQQSLNGVDSKTFLKRVEKLVESELENEEKSSLANERMRARVLQGYYPFNTHAGYKKTAAADGLHVPDEPRFNLLKQGCHLIIYKQHTASQAVRWMNDNGYLTKGGKKLDINHFEEFIEDEYYCGFVKIDGPDWPEKVPGLHVPLLSKREHALLVAIIKKRNPRVRSIHNPDFPMAGLLRHKECEGLGGYEKFTGCNHNPGKTRKGTQKAHKPVYDCRDCRKRVPRDEAHENFSGFLENLVFVPDNKSFRGALLSVWKNQRGSNAQRLRVLNANKEVIEKKIRDTTVTYATESDEVVKSSLRKLLGEYDSDLKKVEIDLHEAENMDMESEDFVKFALEQVETMREKWWGLSWDNKARGEQIIFNGKIYVDNDAKVHTPNLSSIYTLGTNKKALSDMDNAHLVELPGTAPGSVGVYS